MATLADQSPVGFLSYAHADDEADEGRLTEFRVRLEREIRVQTGVFFAIFQDRRDLGWGDAWKKRIEDSIDCATFLIPILTPSYFRSDACRFEFERFVSRERELGRNDLVFPVYYVGCRELEASPKTDPLAIDVAGRHYSDWRKLRFRSYNSAMVATRMAALAEQLATAILRTGSNQLEMAGGVDQGMAAISDQGRRLNLPHSQAADKEDGPGGSAAANVPVLQNLDGAVIDEAYAEQSSLGGRTTRHRGDPAQEIQELPRTPAGHLSLADQRVPEATGPIATTGYRFLDQLTELTTFDIAAFEQFRKEILGEVAARYPLDSTAWEFLSRESLWVDSRLTRTGALLFARNPTSVCPTAMVKCTQYHGNDRTAVKKTITFDGTVPAQIIAARQFVADRSRIGETPSTDQAQLVAVYDLPMVAVREVIANALVHRDYSVADSCIHVRMFSDRLEVTSPGSWVNRDLSPAEQYHLSFLSGQSRKRNYRLAHVLSFIGLVEGEGSGIPAALSSCDAMQSPEPTVTQVDGFVTVVIRRREPGDGIGNPPSFAEQLKSLRLAAQLTSEELADSADLAARTVSDLERGIIPAPHPQTAQRLADALGLEGPIRSSFETAAQGGSRDTGISIGGEVKLTSPHRPWSLDQVQAAGSWPTRRDQPVSVVLSPTADRLALSVGQRLIVSPISGYSLGAPLLQVACALRPGLTWSPLGDKLAFRDGDGKARLLDISGLDPSSRNAGREGSVAIFGTATAMAFSPEGDRFVALAPSSPSRVTLTMFGIDLGAVWELVLPTGRTSSYRSDGVNLAWSPDGNLLACAIDTPLIWLIDTADGRMVGQFEHHSRAVTGLSWIDNERIVSASEDATLQVWRRDGSTPDTVVETIPAAGMVFVRSQGTALIWSADGDLFAWSLRAAPAQLWYREPSSRGVAAHFTRLAVSAVDNLLALVDPAAPELVMVSDWLQTASTPTGMTTYANAKVLLLGDTGVGKSGLAMVLAGERFRPTESTHGRRIWRLPATEEPDAPGGDREVLLWDLAGQPGYRIVHQLHLGGAALALIVFDSRNEAAPLSGVRHWARAVRHAHPLAAGGLPTFLVAARIDRGGVSVSDERIDHLRTEFSIDEYFKTSAFNGTNTDLLRSRILAAIDWECIPKITSTALFAAMRQFVLEQKASDNLLTPLADLSQAFQQSVPSGVLLLDAERTVAEGRDAREASSAELTAVFAGCVARLEAAGLVKRLRYGDYVLLQPELLDAYASAIVNAARDEPDGLGSILESRVIDVGFLVPEADRVSGEQQERLLVYATLEELIRYELVLREETEDGIQLVFPAAYRRDLPVSEAPTGDGVVFRFEGPIENIYSTLIVRLTRSNRFTRTIAWQSAARFAAEGGECTVFLKSDGDGKAELWVGYEEVPRHLRLQFERFVHTQLDRWATPGTVSRERHYSCPEDGATFTAEAVEQVRRRGRDSILCPVCEKRVALLDDYGSIADEDHLTAAMEESADFGRESEAASTVLRGKEEMAEFDVFLCHSMTDKPAVRDIAQRLRRRGLRPWLDEHELRPGMPWQRVLENQIQNIPAAIVVVGSGIGPWQDQELNAFLRQFVSRNCPVIPVLLPGAERPELPEILDGMTWVDLAAAEPDPLDQLEWGITGKHP